MIILSSPRSPSSVIEGFGNTLQGEMKPTNRETQASTFKLLLQNDPPLFWWPSMFEVVVPYMNSQIHA